MEPGAETLLEDRRTRLGRRATGEESATGSGNSRCSTAETPQDRALTDAERSQLDGVDRDDIALPSVAHGNGSPERRQRMTLWLLLAGGALGGLGLL